MDFTASAYRRRKIKENKKIYKYMDLAGELDKATEHRGYCHTNCN